MFTYLRTALFGRPKQCKGLVIGLDAAGKTTFLYKLRWGDVVTTIPTIGFNVETLTSPKWEFNCWDVGGS